MRVTHALTAEGADASEDASEDGTGRGTPLVPWMNTAATLTAGTSNDGVSAPGRRQEDEHNIVPWTVSNDSQPVVVRDGTGALKVGTGLGIPSAPAVAYPLQEVGARTGSSTDDPRAGIGIGAEDDPMYTLQAGHQHGVAYPIQDGREIEKAQNGLGIGDADDPAYTVDTTGGQAVAYPLALRGREGGAQLEVGPADGPYNALRAADGGSSRTPMVATFHENQRGELTTSDTSGALKTGGGKPGQGYPAALVGTAVRRLTPLECERLQGWPDNWTLVPGTSDSQRYKQCGNGITANVAEWIGWRLKAYAEGWRP